MIKVEHISKKYGKKEILRDVSFSVAPGEMIALIGRNGSGKTTLMRILAGVQRPGSGVMEYFGQDPQKDRRLFGRFCGYVPQENPLLEELTVRDNLRLWGDGKGYRDLELCRMFELDEILSVPVEKLSGGMKRRVSIACAVAGWPPVLLMDEPTAAVDLYYKENIRQWMHTYLQRNGMIVLSTHDEQEIAESSRCILLKDGKAIECEKGHFRLDE